jgi:NADP-dependent 3-hydroxy acid dehydrogenase YdfG
LNKRGISGSRLNLKSLITDGHSHERFTKAFNTNVFGVINVTRAVLPHFRSKKSGTVVFLSSSGGMEGEPGAGAYCATKFALEGILLPY